jgi:hypothetical protein
VFCCTFFMLFLAATNDRNHAVSPPNNIKLRPHSILFCLIFCFCLCCSLAYDEQSH